MSRLALQGGDLPKVIGIGSIEIPPRSVHLPEILALRSCDATHT